MARSARTRSLVCVDCGDVVGGDIKHPNRWRLPAVGSAMDTADATPGVDARVVGQSWSNASRAAWSGGVTSDDQQRAVVRPAPNPAASRS